MQLVSRPVDLELTPTRGHGVEPHAARRGRQCPAPRLPQERRAIEHTRDRDVPKRRRRRRAPWRLLVPRITGCQSTHHCASRRDDRHRISDGAPLKCQASLPIVDGMTNTSTVPIVAEARTLFHPDPGAVRRAIERRSVATLATVSLGGRPHAATVLYQFVDDALFVSTSRESRKARNVADRGTAAVTIAVRRMPVGPPASIQFHRRPRSCPTMTERSLTGGRRAARPHHVPRRVGARRRVLSADSAARSPRHLRTRHVPRQVLRHPLDAAGEVDPRSGRT